MRHPSVFEIQLSEKEIIFYGNPTECSGKVLQGTLAVSPTDTMKIRSITLHFSGRMQTHWTTGAGTIQRICSEQRSLIEKKWTFLQPQKKYHVLQAGNYFYDFEITLPGDLPPSVLVDYGMVEYKFKAVLERPTFSINYTDRQNLTIKRALLPSASVLAELIYLSDTWNDMLHYEVYSPSKAFGQGEEIPLHFKLLSLDEGLRVQTVTCLLKEYVTVNAKGEDNNIATKCDGRVQSRVSKTITVPDPSLELTLNVPIPPPARDGAHCHLESDLIKVDHKIKILLVLSDSQDRLHRILAKVSVMIMSTPRQETLNALPRYQSYNDPGLEAAVLRNPDNPNIAVVQHLDEPSTGTTPPVPSYKTQWCPLGNIPSPSSLPSYGLRTAPIDIE